MTTTATARQALTAASTAGFGREDFSALAKVVFALAGVVDPVDPVGQVGPDKVDRRCRARGPLVAPAVILAADHRARGVITIEPYGAYVGAVAAALPVLPTASWRAPSLFVTSPGRVRSSPGTGPICR